MIIPFRLIILEILEKDTLNGILKFKIVAQAEPSEIRKSKSLGVSKNCVDISVRSVSSPEIRVSGSVGSTSDTYRSEIFNSFRGEITRYGVFTDQLARVESISFYLRGDASLLDSCFLYIPVSASNFLFYALKHFSIRFPFRNFHTDKQNPNYLVF